MELYKKRLTYYFLARFLFILGCTLPMFVLHPMTLKPNTSPNVFRIKLLVLVVSAVNNVNRRDAIRETWAQTKGDFKIIFVKSKDKSLNAEKLVHEDLFEVDEKDEYKLLTRKIIPSFSGIYHINFDYLLKCDDNSFVNVPLIVNELEHMPKKRFYLGYFDGNANIKKRGKFKETDWIAYDRYILSKDLII
jgi:galactosylxylosylprotein 3-beta-galactosyltransferase